MIGAMYCLFPFAALGMAVPPAEDGGAAVAREGELARRIEMARDRMLHGETPRFTDDFILADVALRPDYPRRFSNYSGDLSGRYLDAFARMPAAGTKQQLHGLVAKLLPFQKPDGRFGTAALEYTPEKIALDHMALLWGNGRLLVGLLECHALQPDEEVLLACAKLGDFLLGVHEGCADERVTQRVEDLGAAGMICFSQLIEGLVMLAAATDNHAYLDGAEAIVPWFPTDRGQQHSHGYLTTLRGMVMLHEATGKAEYLAKVEALYADLVGSPDYQVYGGVQEYFGGKGDRDEGCSEADFLRLSLQLWRATGNLDYLERAERCLLNQFYANQFDTGDFGHQLHFAQGMAPHCGVGRAWWCCTMHGLRAFRDVLDSVATKRDGALTVNLFLDAAWSDANCVVTLERTGASAAKSAFSITVEKAPAEGVRIALRKPEWADRVALAVNGKDAEASEQDGYVTLGTPLHGGDRLDIAFALRSRIVKRDRTVLNLDQLTQEPIEGALFHGPWLLGVDEAHAPQFFGEPWTGNEILLSQGLERAGVGEGSLAIPAAHIPCEYIHEGFPGRHPLTLRPISERTTHSPATFAAWLKYRRADTK